MFDLKNVSLATLRDLEISTWTDVITATPDRYEGAVGCHVAVRKELERRGVERRTRFELATHSRHVQEIGFNPWR